MNRATSRRHLTALSLAAALVGGLVLTGCQTAPGDPNKNPYGSGAPAGVGKGAPPASANYQNNVKGVRGGPGGPGGAPPTPPASGQ